MARLTKKDYDGMLFWYRNKGGWRMEEIDKLGRYEDVDPRPNYLRKMKKEYLKYKEIEKELGIDLVTLIKAMKNGVFVISYDEGIVFEEPMLGFNQESKTNLYVLESVCHMPPDELCKSSNYYLKDYGKTWALTKEELE